VVIIGCDSFAIGKGGKKRKRGKGDADGAKRELVTKTEDQGKADSLPLCPLCVILLYFPIFKIWRDFRDR